jgi:hypothetical protein
LDSIHYLISVLANGLGLISYESIEEFGNELDYEISRFIDPDDTNIDCPGDTNIEDLAKRIREAKLIRHQFVAWPLIEYSEYKGSLVNIDLSNIPTKIKKKIRGNDINFSPRFIHMHEVLCFNTLNYLGQGKINSRENVQDDVSIINYFKNSIKVERNAFEADQNPPKLERWNHFIKESNKKSSLCIGVVNNEVLEEHLDSSMNPQKTPELSVKRQTDLFKLINEAIRQPKCDLIVFPELSIPVSWLPFMVNQAKKHNVGMVFGLEYWPIEKGDHKEVFNLVVTLLPFITSSKYKNCYISLRNKIHYSPKEQINIKSLQYQTANEKPKSVVDRYFWRGCVFSVYNCFELTDIELRLSSRSLVDLLISVSWNRDTNHFANIIESTARDVHCYLTQANTSQYGDSRIVQPKRTEKRDIINIKGGKNSVLVKGEIDIKDLRDFQQREYRSGDKRFKPTPAGFNKKEVNLRNDPSLRENK